MSCAYAFRPRTEWRSATTVCQGRCRSSIKFIRTKKQLILCVLDLVIDSQLLRLTVRAETLTERALTP